MRNKLLPVIALTLICSLLMSGAGALADSGSADVAAGTAAVASTEEVIYGILGADGAPESAYAVAILNVDSAGTALHYGEYSAVKNLTDDGAISYSGDTVTAQVGEGRYYYQGDLSSCELPWLVDVAYCLDGEEISPEQLGGSTGTLEMGITVSRNTNAASQVFFDKYLLQITVSLDTMLCSSISTSGATAANSGADKLLTFTVMPGEESTTLFVYADVVNFRMDSISVAGVPYDIGSSVGNISELTNGLSQLASGMSQLASGAYQLSSGTAQLSSGIATFGGYLSQLSAGSASLVDASSQIYGGLAQLNDGIGALAALSLLNSGISDLITGVNTLYSNYGAFHAGLVEYTGGVDQLAASWSELQSGADSVNYGAASLSQGTNAVSSETSGLPDAVDEMLGTGDEGETLVSFLSSKNDASVIEVQFVIRTDPIELPQIAVTDAETGQLTFWDRVKALFE